MDFLTLNGGDPEFLIETKLSGQDVSQLRYFSKNFSCDIKKMLLVQETEAETDIGRIEIRKAGGWLKNLES